MLLRELPIHDIWVSSVC